MPLIIRRARAALLAGALLALAGCASAPDDALRLTAQSDHDRALQTRRFDGLSEATLLAATAGVLQDLGFTLDESESRLGVVTASRQLTSRRPMNRGELMKDLAWTLLIPTLGATFTALDAAAGVKEPQLVRVSLVTRAADQGSPLGASARVTAQRVVYADERLTKIVAVEPLNDPLFYREFFTRLSQSVFLEEHKP